MFWPRGCQRCSSSFWTGELTGQDIAGAGTSAVGAAAASEEGPAPAGASAAGGAPEGRYRGSGSTSRKRRVSSSERARSSTAMYTWRTCIKDVSGVAQDGLSETYAIHDRREHRGV